MQNKPIQSFNQPNNDADFAPHVTVATVVERQGKFLLVEETSNGLVVLNQPAGHLEANESLIDAAKRETFEETGWHVEITGVLSVELYTSPRNGVTYHRTTFVGKAIEHDSSAQLDEGILRALWLSPEEITGFRSAPRSPLVLKAIEQYLLQQPYPLSLIKHYPC